MSRAKRATFPAAIGPTSAAPGDTAPAAADVGRAAIPAVASGSEPGSLAPAATAARPPSLLPELEVALRARSPLVYLVAAEEERALSLLERAATALERRVYVWTQTRGLGPARGGRADPALADPLAVLDHVMAASAEPAAYALLDIHPLLTSPVVVRKLKDAARALHGSSATVVLVAPVHAAPPELWSELRVLALPPPRADEIAAAIDALTERAGLPVSLEPRARAQLVRAAQGLALKQVAAALADAVVAHGGLDARAVGVMRRARQHALDATGLLAAVEPAVDGLAAVGGLDVLKRWVERRAEVLSPRAPSREVPAPRGLLLVGAPGTGKALCARAVAAAWDLPLLRMDAASALCAADDTARRALALAQSASPCVLWVDGLDRAFGPGGAPRETARGLALLSTWLHEHEAGVVTLATARGVEALPAELLRKGRFDEVFFLDLPTPAERVEVFRVQLEQRGHDAGAFDLESLAEASEGFSGAEIAHAVVDGMVHALEQRGRALATRDVLRALREAVPLSRAHRAHHDALRAWAAGGGARAASAAPPRTAGPAGHRITV